MSDAVVKIYLYVLMGTSVFLFLLYVVIWLIERYRSRQFLVKTKYLWRNLFFLISGLFGSYLFSQHLMSNNLILIATFIMLVVSTYTAHLIEIFQSSGGEDERAT